MRSWLWPALALFLFATHAAAAPSIAELAGRLKNGEDFRLRVAAALELGKTSDPDAVAPLIGALDDPNASVRAAAVAALEQLGDERALPALRERRLDRSSAVRAAIKSAIATLERPAEERPAKVLVQIGAMKNRTGVKALTIEAELEQESRRKLKELPGVEVLSREADSGSEAKRKKLPVVMVSGHIQKLRASREGQEVVYSASVEYILHTMPDQAIAAKVTGSATASLTPEEARDKQRSSELRRQVLDAAIASALRRAPRALLAAARL